MEEIMKYAHEGGIGGHCIGKTNVDKIVYVGIWRPTIFRDTKDYCNTCDVCQRVGSPSRRDEMSLIL